jgi:hypothetical protein
MKTRILLSIACLCLLATCNADRPTEPFAVDGTYCDRFPENCLPDESTGKPEIYCGRNHDGKRCDCEVDRVGRPMAVRECHVWTR